MDLEQATARIAELEGQVKASETALESVRSEATQAKALSAALEKQIVEVKAKADSASALEAKVQAAAAALSGLHSRAILGEAIDPIVYDSAPKLEVGDDWNPKPESVKALTDWRTAKAHLFRSSPGNGPALPRPGGDQPEKDEAYWRAEMTKPTWRTQAKQDEFTAYVRQKNALKR